MRTPDIEGVATHGGPESCVDGPRGRWRSVDRGTYRPAIEPRNHHFGVPTSSHEAEGNIAGGASASRPAGRARSENLRMHGVFMRENREIPLLARLADHWAGRPGNAEAVSME
jgi:RNA-directed DNA polymerase